jgi:peroxiredoxin
MPEIGEIAPEVALHGARGEEFSLADLRGRSAAVLFFYPKDQTGG